MKRLGFDESMAQLKEQMIKCKKVVEERVPEQTDEVLEEKFCEHIEEFGNYLYISGYPLNDNLPPVLVGIDRDHLQKILNQEFDGIKVEDFSETYTWDDTDIILDVIQSNNISQDKVIIEDYKNAKFEINVFDVENGFKGKQVESYWPDKLTKELAEQIVENYEGYYIEIAPVGKSVFYDAVIDSDLVDCVVKEFDGVSQTLDDLIDDVDSITARTVVGKEKTIDDLETR